MDNDDNHQPDDDDNNNEDSSEGEEDDESNGQNEADEEDPVMFRMDDPARMQLTEEERQWALQIKAAVEETENDIDPLPDFTYAHLAIFYQGNIEAALESALGLQGFRQDNDILDTLEDSRKSLAKIIQLFPKMYLSYTFNEEDGNYYLAYDITQFHLQKFTRTEMYTTWNAGHYYLCHALSVDFYQMRKGIIVLAECQGYDFTQNMNIKMVQKVWLEIACTYPIQYQKAKHYNAGVMFNVFLSMLKKIIPAKMGNTFETGLRTDFRLDTLFLTPSVEAANQRLLQFLDTVLQRRYELEKSFSLNEEENGNSAATADTTTAHRAG